MPPRLDIRRLIIKHQNTTMLSELLSGLWTARCRQHCMQAAILWTILGIVLINFLLMQQEKFTTSSSSSSSEIGARRLLDVRKALESVTAELEVTKPRCDNTTCIADYFSIANRQQRIRNRERFELNSDLSTIVIVVQVHDRVDYLRTLVNSLRNVREVSDVLLIFSHDYYSTEIDDVVSSVDFCLVMQIFFPLSTQIYPNIFPGTDPKDCPKNISKPMANQLRCNSADFPDHYGHYREARITQAKHHWFWKANHVLDHLKVMRHFQGLVLFLEEDQYLIEDSLIVLRQMYRLKSRLCRDCAIVTLGTHAKNPEFGSSSNKVDIMYWESNKHNMGMAFDRSVWKKIKKCTPAFCHYDDYNWDWSLHLVGVLCFPNKMKVMAVKSPRVLHVGECGMHSKSGNCNPQARVSVIETLLRNQKNNLFPNRLQISSYVSKQASQPKPNGGWSDPRDVKLCLQFANDTLNSTL